MKFFLDSPALTREIAGKIAPLLLPGDMIAYEGGMGAGKTTFTAALLLALHYKGEVTSPTFSLLHEYKLPMESNIRTVFHFDLYRIMDEESLYQIGFFDYLKVRDALFLLEWSENIKSFLPPEHLTFRFSYAGEEERILEILGGNGRFEHLSL